MYAKKQRNIKTTKTQIKANNTNQQHTQNINTHPTAYHTISPTKHNKHVQHNNQQLKQENINVNNNNKKQGTQKEKRTTHNEI